MRSVCLASLLCIMSVSCLHAMDHQSKKLALQAPHSSSTQLHKIPSLKLLSALQLYKRHLASDHLQLYVDGKKLLDAPCAQLPQIGLDYVKKAAELGNPFAAERVADELRESQPEQAALYYYKALHAFNTRTPWKSGGCYKREQLTGKINTLNVQEGPISSYQAAHDHGTDAVFEQYHSQDYNKNNDVDALVKIVQRLETQYAQNQKTADAYTLELLGTSGVLRYMELFRNYKPIQNVLINALALRAHVGHGYVLKEHTALAHYKKALHFIINPKKACKDLLDALVPDDVFLTPVKIDGLPEQQRSIYLEGMLGIVEHLAKDVQQLDEKKARYICNLFMTAAYAMAETNDNNLKLLHARRYTDLLAIMHTAACATQSTDHMIKIAYYYVHAGNADRTIEAYWSAADQLYTRAMGLDNGTLSIEAIQAIPKTHSRIKYVLSGYRDACGDYKAAECLLRQAVAYNSNNTEAWWELSQLLITDDQIELRQEGLEIIRRLAEKSHRQALLYMVNVHHKQNEHMSGSDALRVVRYLKILIKDDKAENTTYRLTLAKIYIELSKSNGWEAERKAHLNDALALVLPYKDRLDRAHINYVIILYESGLIEKLMREVQRYKPSGTRTADEVYYLADFYYKYARAMFENPSRFGIVEKAAKKMLIRAQELLQPVKGHSHREYLLLLNVLLAQNSDQLDEELARNDDKIMDSLKDTFRARSLLLQHWSGRFDEAANYLERSLASYTQQFVDAEVQADAICSIPQRVQEANNAEPVSLCHQAKEATFEALTKTSKCISSVIARGDYTDEVHQRMLAYNGYFSAQIAMLELEFETATYDDVLKMLGLSVDAAGNIDDQECKMKILKLMCDQIHFWVETRASAGVVVRAKRITALLGLCNKLRKDSTDCQICTQFHDIVVFAHGELHKLDVSECPDEDIRVIMLQIQLIDRLYSQFGAH